MDQPRVQNVVPTRYLFKERLQVLLETLFSPETDFEIRVCWRSVFYPRTAIFTVEPQQTNDMFSFRAPRIVTEVCHSNPDPIIVPYVG